MRLTALLAVCVAIALPTARSAAQSPLSFGVLAGAALPTGDAGEALQTGFSAGVTFGLAPSMLPVGIRVDALWSGMDYQAHGDATHRDENLAVISLTSNAIFSIPTGAITGVSPYLIGGVGLYSADDPHLADRQNEFGWNLGGGLRFPLAGYGAFVEARFNSFHMEGETVSYVPITLGLMF